MTGQDAIGNKNIYDIDYQYFVKYKEKIIFIAKVCDNVFC